MLSNWCQDKSIVLNIILFMAKAETPLQHNDVEARLFLAGKIKDVLLGDMQVIKDDIAQTLFKTRVDGIPDKVKHQASTSVNRLVDRFEKMISEFEISN